MKSSCSATTTVRGPHDAAHFVPLGCGPIEQNSHLAASPVVSGCLNDRVFIVISLFI